MSTTIESKKPIGIEKTPWDENSEQHIWIAFSDGSARSHLVRRNFSGPCHNIILTEDHEAGSDEADTIRKICL